MAVQLPSDIVTDVMRNADPARRLAALERLQFKAVPAGADFAGYSRELELQESVVAGSGTIVATEFGGNVATADQSKVFRDFERVVLHSLFETLLPGKESGSFGSGPSAGVWRSMAAEQLADVYARNGGLGIGEMLAASSGGAAMRREPQWPYFALETIEGFRS